MWCRVGALLCGYVVVCVCVAHAWVCGCVDVWVCGCVVCGSVGVGVRGCLCCAYGCAFGCVVVWVCRCADVVCSV